MKDSIEIVRSNYNNLVTLLEEETALRNIKSLMTWDQLVMMPPNGVQPRAKQIAVLAGVLHDKSVNPEIGTLLTDLEKSDLSSLNEWERANIRDARRNYDRIAKVPKELVKKEASLQTRAYGAWVTARKQNDFAKFAPLLKEWVELRKEVARYIDPSKPVYDVLMDGYERDLTMKRADEVFAVVKEKLIPLINKIKKSPEPDRSFLDHKYEIEKQVKFNQQVAKDIGFNMDSGRLDTSAHPVTVPVSITDIRMTTRYKDTDFIFSIAPTVHESGHSMYEQARPKDHEYLPVSQAVSAGIHESQALCWERMVGLSQPFWEFYWPKVKEIFPQIDSTVTLDQFYKAINIVKSSLIRVEADQVTYPLHVILRYEIEKGIFDGTFNVDDLPKIWNDKMKEYLGIVPPTDADGVLQDTHWAIGYFGYFPTYLLGSIYASQFYAQAEKEIPNLQEEFRKGNFKPLKEWLNSKIHSKGSLIPNGDLLAKEVTGEPLNPQVFVDYLYVKYGQIYQF